MCMTQRQPRISPKKDVPSPWSFLCSNLWHTSIFGYSEGGTSSIWLSVDACLTFVRRMDAASRSNEPTCVVLRDRYKKQAMTLLAMIVFASPLTALHAHKKQNFANALCLCPRPKQPCSLGFTLGLYVCMCVRTYARTYVRTYVRMYVCTYVCACV